jgi:hypothetical protein
VRAGYRREFQVGLPADGSEVPSPTCRLERPVVRVPRPIPKARASAGIERFCADYTGRICVTMDGSRPRWSMDVRSACIPLGMKGALMRTWSALLLALLAAAPSPVQCRRRVHALRAPRAGDRQLHPTT